MRIREIFPLLLFLLGLEWRMMVSVSGPELHAANKKQTEDCVAYWKEAATKGQIKPKYAPAASEVAPFTGDHR